MNRKQVLLIKMSSLGDVVHALPAVNDASANGAQIDWVVEEAFADIPAAHPGVRRVLPIAWRRWRRNPAASRLELRAFIDDLRSRSYDLIIDSQGLIKSAAVSLLAKGRRTGFSFTSAREPWSAFVFGRGHRVVRAQHAIDRQRQLFAAALGYEPEPHCCSGLEGRRTISKQVILLHGTTWETKHWPLFMWRSLAEQIRADGFEPVVTWGNAEEQARARIIAQGGVASVRDKLSLQALRPVLANAAAVIGVDSGLCHYSAALGTPTLGLYGPTDGELTGCRGLRARFIQAGTDCAPCLSRRCRSYVGERLLWQGQDVHPPCFATVPPHLVWAEAQRLMGATVS